MDNLVLWRLSIALTTIVAFLAGFFAYLKLTFPFNFAVIAACAAAIGAHMYFLQRKEKDARFNAFYTAVQDFGTPVSFTGHDASFERNGTVFEAEFPYGKHHQWFVIKFSIPGLYEQFIIQHREIINKDIDGCEYVNPSPLEQHFIVRSRNAEFLLNLLKDKKILNQVYNYPASFMRRFIISFDSGDFELVWTPDVSDQIDGFYKICETATVFHDELKKLAKSN